jgi:hypothetical protein
MHGHDIWQYFKQSALSHRRLRGTCPSVAVISNAFVIAVRKARIVLWSSALCWMLSKENELCYAA